MKRAVIAAKPVHSLLGLLLLALCGLGFASGQTTTPSPFTSVVVFGDSLSDTGNVAHVSSNAFLVRYPSAPFNYTDGRFTDGADTTPAAKAFFGVWHEQLAMKFSGLTPAKNSLDGGLDYAYGAATTQDGTSIVSAQALSITVEDMGQQVTDYLTGPGKTPDPTALYVLWGGGDDLFSDATLTNIVAAPARIAALASRLATAGAVNILIPNLPPLGSTPGLNGQPAAAAALNAATVAYNAQLSSDLDTLQARLTTAGVHVRLYRLDVFGLYQKLTTNPGAYGLNDLTDMAKGLASSVNPDTYLFWDDVHPTTAAHYQIAAAAYSLLIPQVALTVTPASPTPGEAVTFTAVVTSQPPIPAPTGSVNFYNGTTLLGTGTLDSTGTATFTASTLAPGTYNVTAAYSGDASNLTSTSTVATVKIAAPSATTLTVVPTKIMVGTTVMLTATVTGASGVPTGTVSFLYGTTVVGTATLNASGLATFSATSPIPGTYPVSASYAGDSVYGASVSATQTITVLAGNTTTTLTSSLNPAGSGQAVVFTAVVAPGAGMGVPTGTVTFLDGTTSIGTGALDTTGKATLSVSNLTVGAHSITASYPGDANYLGSTSAALTETIATPSVAFAANPTSITITRGSTGTTTITGTPTGGFSGTATFACSNLPVHASCTFAPASLAFTGGSTALTTTLTISTKATTSAAIGGAMATNVPWLGPNPRGRGGLLALLCMPWLGVAATFRKKRGANRALMLVLAVLSMAAAAGLTACGSSSNTTPKGAYSVTVTVSGTGAASTLTIPVTVQ